MTATIRDAATVVIVRDSGDPGRADRHGLDVWLMQRQPTMAFAAGAHVFPGGSVDVLDDDPMPTRGGPFESYSAALGVDEARGRRLVAAAVRETFEECGLVLAAGGEWSEQDRVDLVSNRCSVASLVRRDSLEVDLNSLLPWTRWLTPDFVPRRYDTWFFLFAAASQVGPVHIGDEEAVDARWWSVRAALEANRIGEMMLLLPTYTVLRELSRFADVAEAFAGGRLRVEQRSG